MRLIVDTSGLLSMAERDVNRRVAVAQTLAAEQDPPVLSAFIAAELDYFLQKLQGQHGNRKLIEDMAGGRFDVPCLQPADFDEIQRLNDRYRDLSLGLTDLSLVVLAARYRTTRILTFDQRHFRPIRPLQGGVFTLLPFDEDIP